MLLTAAFFVLSQQTALEPPASGVAPVAPVGSGAAREVLPGPVSRAYLTAQGALREGDDVTALTHWKRARALFADLPAEQRYAREVRDAAVRHELRLVEVAKGRFDRIRAPVAGVDASGDLGQRTVEKRRLFAMLAGNPAALDADGFAGALRYIPELNTSLRGVHCQRAELTMRFYRWLSDLPCASELSDSECELTKARAAQDDTSWRGDVARAEAACKGSP